MGNPLLNIIMDKKGGIGMNHSTWTTEEGKIIYFIRHAQAQHNVHGDHSIPDPRLTQQGVRQAQRIRDGFPADALANIELIVTSPMRRTIQTTLLGFRTQIEWMNLPVKLLPDLQETNDYPCDTGSPSSILIQDFPSLEKEISELPASWYVKAGGNAATEDALKRRAAEARRWLLERREKVIVVMSHHGFLRYLVGEELWTSNGTTPNGFHNAEVRRYRMNANGQIKDDGIVHLERNAVADEVAAVGYLP